MVADLQEATRKNMDGGGDPASASGYRLCVSNELVEACPVDVSSFRAILRSARHSDGTDLALIDGVMLDGAVEGDVCVKVADRRRRSPDVKRVETFVGEEATEMMRHGVDAVVVANTPRLLFLYDAYIVSPDDRQLPGTRLLAALSRLHDREATTVSVDFGSEGDDDEDRREFLRCFFTGLPQIGLRIGPSDRFARGTWGPMDRRQSGASRLGIIYGQ